jgi:flagellar hook-associated protein 3 FlgL
VRITQRAVALTSLQGLNRNLEAVGRLQQQLTSGRQINAPSDSPTGTNRAMQTRGDAAATAQYARNISDGRSRLDATDSALTSMLEQVRKVRDLTVQAGNTGALSPTALEGIATEADQLQQSLLALANSTLQGRPLFGGIATGNAAYAADGSYLGRGGGDGQQVLRRVSDTEVIRVDITGAEAFVDPDTGEDLFAVIGDVVTAMRAGDSAGLSAGLARIDGVMGAMLTAVADVGARARRIESAEQVTADRELTLTQRLAETENIDLPKTIMELEMQKVGYEAALSATAKSLQPTLVDFLQ